jgi:surfeit locus 1 family protein
MRRFQFFMIIGLGGAAILLALGVWQMQRLAWKQGVIAGIDARIAAAPVPLPADPDPTKDSYLPVTLSGDYVGNTLRVLVSQKAEGAGYRLITAMDTPQGRILVDRGFVATSVKGIDAPDQLVEVTGNLQWPQETDGFTPEPDVDKNIWYARDVNHMAKVLDTNPVLLVARRVSIESPSVRPLPVDTSRIPNNHLQYAITWFSLAAIWLAMSFYFLRSRTQRPES